MSKKSELLSVIKNYKDKQEAFINMITNIRRDSELTQEGAEKRVNELAAQFESAAQNAHDKAIDILDSGIEALEKKWRDNSTGKLKDSNYQIGLANTIKMIETGAINNKEDFKNIIEVYKDDYNALATINKLLGPSNDKFELVSLIPQDNREYNRKFLNDLRSNLNNSININTISQNMVLSFAGLIQSIEDRLTDDLTIIPWNQVK